MKVWRTMTISDADGGHPCRAPASQGNPGNSSPDTKRVVEASLCKSMMIRTTGWSPANRRKHLKRKRCETLGKAGSMSMNKGRGQSPLHG